MDGNTTWVIIHFYFYFDVYFAHFFYLFRPNFYFKPLNFSVTDNSSDPVPRLSCSNVGLPDDQQHAVLTKLDLAIQKIDGLSSRVDDIERKLDKQAENQRDIFIRLEKFVGHDEKAPYA